jgi:UDP-N-acetylmuramoylalanine--D-glutamate ligase
MKDWSGQKVVILGAARQGTALARYLARHGARVILNDSRPVEALKAARNALADLPSEMGLEWVCGGHPLSILDEADLLCISGGVPLTNPLVVEARRRGIPLSNDSQIFLEAAPCKVIGITGSAGKTTTTTLVGRMAGEGRRVFVGGNIGVPLISVLDELEPDDLAVMELSSFQLEIMTRSPQVAAVLNVTPNHLDRHGSMEAYTAAKARILEFQSPQDVAVLSRDDSGAWSLKDKVQSRLVTFGLGEPPSGQDGTFLRGDELILRAGERRQRASQGSGDKERRLGAGENMDFPPAPLRHCSPADLRLMSRTDIQLRGEHNLLNVLAACAIAAAAGLPVEAMRAGVEGFHGVPHRLEFVRRWGGADWYNDSIATAPERAMAALRSFNEPLVLLAGGRDKDLPWEDFAGLVRRRVRHLILFGEAAGLIEHAVENSQGSRGAGEQGSGGVGEHAYQPPSPSGRVLVKTTGAGGEGEISPLQVSRCNGLHDAVQEAARIVQPGDVVLLSPGGTSFDEFIDFEERGEWFKKWVMLL